MMTMPLFSHFAAVLFILYQSTSGVWSSNIHKQEYYKHTSSEEELNIEFKTSNAQYYNSREAHGDILEIVDGTNVTKHYLTNSKESSKEEIPGSISTILEDLHNKPDKYPYPLGIGSHEGYESTKYDQDNVEIRLDISDYLEALSDKKEAANEYTNPFNTRSNYGQVQSGVIFAEHRYPVPLSNYHLPRIGSKEVSSKETFGIYSSEIESVRYGELTSAESPENFGIYSSNKESVSSGKLTSAESSETTESWALLAIGQSRIRPGVPQDFDTTEVSLPKCSKSDKNKKQNRCGKEQNFCRSTGDCRIARIWGTCCNDPGCGSYCQREGSVCPHPNNLKDACKIKSDKVCNPLHDECPRVTHCCQTPCGFRCV